MSQHRTERARDLRRTDSRAEQAVWELLRAHRMSGLKFRRQHPIGPYYTDFACVARRLVIEIDGDHHGLQIDADAQRTHALAQEGLRIVRFNAREAVANPEGIWTSIERLLRKES